MGAVGEGSDDNREEKTEEELHGFIPSLRIL